MPSGAGCLPDKPAAILPGRGVKGDLVYADRRVIIEKNQAV